MLEALEPIWGSLGDQLASSGDNLGRFGGHQVVVASGGWCIRLFCSASCGGNPGVLSTYLRVLVIIAVVGSNRSSR